MKFELIGRIENEEIISVNIKELLD